MKDEKEEIKPAPLKSWKDWCREAGTECGCGDVCMYAPKPAPLGESSEEQKDGFMIIDVFNDDGSHSHYALISTKTGEKLWSENPKECKAQGYPVSSPASEPPEEQAELWKEARRLIDTWQIDELFKNFIIHRKRE